MSGPALAFDPADPAFLVDPYPTYRMLRQAAPVVWADGLNAWVVSRYSDVLQVLRDPRMGVSIGNARAYAAAPLADPRLEGLTRMMADQLLFRDPPEHTRLRGLVNKAFTPRVVERMRPHLSRLVSELLDGVARAGEMDLIADLAYPLPVTVIAVLLGVPVEDHGRFRGWSQALASTVEPAPPLEALYAAGEAADEILEYFLQLIARKRADPQEDLLSELIHAEEQGQSLSLDELLANAVLLLVAGHETTVNLIGNGVLALLRHPEELARLRREPGLMENAVEELLRYDSPVQITSRIAGEGTSVAGQPLAAGDEVLLLLGSANRDEARFADPERLDLARTDCKHLSFGSGIHYCVGAPLARAEARVALAGLLERFKVLNLADDEPPRRPSAALRGLQSLRVTFS